MASGITSMADEILWFRAENEKLKKQWHELFAANREMVGIVAKIEAENDRLRAALRQIADDPNGSGQVHAEEARAALATDSFGGCSQPTVPGDTGGDW